MCGCRKASGEKMLNFFVSHPTYLIAALAKRRSQREKKRASLAAVFLCVPPSFHIFPLCNTTQLSMRSAFSLIQH
jgi:hypothetical protein